MRVLLIQPNRPGVNADFPPMGLMYLATALRTHGHEPSILDAKLCNLNAAAVSGYVADNKPDMIGISVLSAALHQTKDVIREIRKVSKAQIVCGGHHVTGVGPRAIDELGADFCIAGEGERALPMLANGSPKQTIPGLIWRSRVGTLWSNDPDDIQDIDALGWPAWDLCPPAWYWDRPVFPRGICWVLTSRGCPFRCGFCVKLGRKLRTRPVESVYAEIEWLDKTYGCNLFVTLDEGFAMNVGRAKAIARHFIAQGNHYRYMVGTGFRLSVLDEELLDVLAEARFLKVSAVGIESASDRVRKLMNKNLSDEDIRSGVTMMQKHGWQTYGLFILGYPGDTRAEMWSNLKLAIDLRLDGAQFNPFIPLPGTPAVDQLQASGELPADFDFGQMSQDCVLYAPPGMTKKDIIRFKQWAAVRFNLQWHVLKRHLHPPKDWVAYSNVWFSLYRLFSILVLQPLRRCSGEK